MLSRKLLIASVLCMVYELCLGATYRDPNPNRNKPPEFENEEGCYYERSNIMIPYGETITPVGICERVFCSNDGQLDGATCGSMSTDDDNCYLVEDLNQPYPDCCPQPHCDTENELSTEDDFGVTSED